MSAAAGSPAVDVIIPTYNGMPLLQDTVESIRAQTYTNWRLHVVDDGSPDEGRTREYVEGLADSRVAYYRIPNGRQAAARNFGIAASSAPYVAFCDADDLWRPDKLSKQMALFGRDPELGLVYGHHELLDHRGATIGRVEGTYRGWIFDRLLRGNCVAGSASMVVIPRSVFASVGTFREDFAIGEDWEMWMRIARRFRVDVVPETLAALRVLPGGMQRDYRKMADGLLFLGPAVTEAFSLTGRRRAQLTATVLWDAAHYFRMADDPGRARSCLRALARAKPAHLLRPVYWPGVARTLLSRRSHRVDSTVFRLRD